MSKKGTWSFWWKLTGHTFILCKQILTLSVSHRSLSVSRIQFLEILACGPKIRHMPWHPSQNYFFSHFFPVFKSSNRQLSFALSRVKKYVQLSILEPSEIENFKKKVFLKNFFFQKIKNFRQYFSRIYWDFKLV